MKSKPSSSGIREKFRSNILNKLALDKGVKRRIDDNEDEDDNRLNPEKKLAANCDLLSILPKPQNSSFGPTIKLEKLLKTPKALPTSKAERTQSDSTELLEVDIGKLVSEDRIIDSGIGEKPKIVVDPKQKQKNQITYLAQLGKATEIERKDQQAQSRFNKTAARAKYGW